jgi:hypothetical protein
MNQQTICCIAFYGPFAPSNPLTWQARLALCSMAMGAEQLAELSDASGLSTVETIDAMVELGRYQLVLWMDGRAWYRIGGRFQSLRGEVLGDESELLHFEPRLP